MCAKKRSIGCSRCDDIIKEHSFLTTYIHTYIHIYIKTLIEIRYGFPGLKMMDLEEARLSDPSAETKRYEQLGIFLIHTYIHICIHACYRIVSRDRMATGWMYVLHFSRAWLCSSLFCRSYQPGCWPRTTRRMGMYCTYVCINAFV